MDASSVTIRLENTNVSTVFVLAAIIVNGGSTRDSAAPGSTSAGVALSDASAGLWHLTKNTGGIQVLVFISNVKVFPGPACFVEAQAIQSN